jgi:hypothetical protein
MLVVFLFLLSLVFAPSAMGQTVYWASPNGNDSGTCTSSATDPGVYLTIGRAAVCATTSPWIIYLKSGTYSQSTHLIDTQQGARHSSTFVSGISAVNPNIVRTAPGETRAVITARNGLNGWVQLYHTGTPNPARNYITFKEFVYDGLTVPEQGLYLTGANLTLEDCEVRNTLKHSIFSGVVVGSDGSRTFPSSGHVIRRCELHHTQQSYAWYGGARNSIFENNTCHNVRSACLQYQYDHSNGIVRNNYIHTIAINALGDNQCNGMYVAQKYNAAGVDTAGASGVQFYNNIVDLRNCPSGSGSSGVQISRAPGMLIANNVFIGARLYGLYFVFGNTIGANISNNIMLQSLSRHIFVDSGSAGTTYTVSHNACETTSTNANCGTNSNGTTDANKKTIAIITNCTVSTTDFHLHSNVPNLCKDGGTTVSAVTTDYEGTARPQGAAYDIGVDEFPVSVDTQPPAAPTGLTVQ